MSDNLTDGRRFWVLNVLDKMSGTKRSVGNDHGVGNGPEFIGKAF